MPAAFARWQGPEEARTSSSDEGGGRRRGRRPRGDGRRGASGGRGHHTPMGLEMLGWTDIDGGETTINVTQDGTYTVSCTATGSAPARVRLMFTQ